MLDTAVLAVACASSLLEFRHSCTHRAKALPSVLHGSARRCANEMGSVGVSASGDDSDAHVSEQKPSGEWWTIIKTLSASSPQEEKPRGPHSEINTCSTIRRAIAAAESNKAWAGAPPRKHCPAAGWFLCSPAQHLPRLPSLCQLLCFSKHVSKSLRTFAAGLAG